jgi:hypothetical protein
MSDMIPIPVCFGGTDECPPVVATVIYTQSEVHKAQQEPTFISIYPFSPIFGKAKAPP